MPVPSRLTDLSATAASNSPAGSDSIGTSLDDYLRGIQAAIRGDLASKGSDIASDTTADLGAVQGSYHDITGTTTVTGLGTVSAGIHKWVKFEGAVPLVHNATSLILPGGANITTADGDTALFYSEGSGNWRCLSYQRAAKIPANDRPVIGSAVATTSGTSVAISTAIPSWAKKLTLLFSGVSLSGTADVIVQIGPTGGLDTSGYVSESAILTAASTGVSSSTAGFIIRISVAASVFTGRMDINLSGTSNQWISSHAGRNNTTSLVVGGGSVTASGTITRVSVLSSNGSDTFDAGAVTLVYE